MILENNDDAVAKWVWEAYHIRPIKLYKAIGILNSEGFLVGAILLSNFNGFNIEFGYYGKDTVTFNLCRWIAQLGVKMNLARVTIITSKKNKRVIRFLPAIGARLEGVSRRYYGFEDCPRNTGVRFVMFREDLMRMAYGPEKRLPNAISS